MMFVGIIGKLGLWGGSQRLRSLDWNRFECIRDIAVFWWQCLVASYDAIEHSHWYSNRWPFQLQFNSPHQRQYAIPNAQNDIWLLMILIFAFFFNWITFKCIQFISFQKIIFGYWWYWLRCLFSFFQLNYIIIVDID